MSKQVGSAKPAETPDVEDRAGVVEAKGKTPPEKLAEETRQTKLVGLRSKMDSSAQPPERIATRKGPTLHLDAIESLRGWAALYVVAYHLLYVPSHPPAAPGFAKSFLNAGHSGVTLFFVISAFTLCLSSSNRSGEPRPLLRFYLRRVFRILPLFLVLLVVTIARSWYLYRVVPGPAAIGANLSFLYNFIPGHQDGIVWASWTLGVEMVFYAFFPLIFRLVNSLGRAVIFFFLCIGVALGVGAWVHYRPNYFDLSIFRHLPAFAAGFILFFVFQNYRTRLRRGAAAMLIFAGCAGHWILSAQDPFDYGQRVATQSLIWATLALGLCVFPLGIFVNALTKFAGRISYSVYLVHPLIIFALSPVIARLASATGSWHFAVCFIVVTLVIVAVATITFRLIEQPGMQWGSRLIKKHCV